jgi:hypothetical protein
MWLIPNLKDNYVEALIKGKQSVADEGVSPAPCPKGIFSGATQTDVERPFMSVVTGNASGPSFSGATQSVCSDANLAQIYVRFASLRTLRGRVECPPKKT